MPLTLQFISKTTTEQEPTNRPTNKQTNERNREYNKQTKTPITTRIPSLYFNGCAIKTTHHILTILCIYICTMYNVHVWYSLLLLLLSIRCRFGKGSGANVLWLWQTSGSIHFWNIYIQIFVYGVLDSKNFVCGCI